MTPPLCILAVDQRGWLTDALYGAGTEPDASQVRDIKLAVAQGAAGARKVPGELGLLVDERYGAGAARYAKGAGLTLAMPIELDRQPVLTPEYGDGWPAHLDAFDPELPKLLIWHNVETDRATLDAQLDRLAGIATALREQRRAVMLEILAPPTDAQLARCDGDRDRYDRDLLPGLTLSAIEEVLAAGVHVDVWKLEGMPDAQAFRQVRERCERANPETRCLVLGRNAPQPQVDKWLTDAAAAGFGGFAIGRSVWWQPIRDWVQGQTDRDTAVARVAGNYADVCETFSAAVG